MHRSRASSWREGCIGNPAARICAAVSPRIDATEAARQNARMGCSPARPCSAAGSRLRRRSTLALLAAAALLPLQAPAQVRRADPRRALRLGVDRSLADSGLAARLADALARDTGLRLDIVPGPSLALLEGLDRVDVDAAITNTPRQDAEMARAGLAHDRRFLAGTDFVIVGPLEQGRDPAGLRDPRRPADLVEDAERALRDIAASGGLGRARFVMPEEGSGAHVCEQGLWAALGVVPRRDFRAGWYLQSGPQGALAEAVAQRAYTLVDRIGLHAQRTPGLGIVAAGDPRLDCPYHVMLAFRERHPAGRMVMDWLTGPAGRRVVAAHGAGGVRYRSAP